QPDERFQTAVEFREALRRIEGFTTLRSKVMEPVTLTRRSNSPSNPGSNPAIDPSRAQIEAALLKSLGPIARILVARIAPQCATAAELRDRLAAQIEDPQDRKAFLSQLVSGPGGGNANTPSNGKPAVEVITQWDPVTIASAKQQLALYAGPIASVIVDRAAKKARTPFDLYQVLAAEIPSERDRAAFLKHALP